jgi:hypothetical protein
VKSVYNKINNVEAELSRQLVSQTAARVKRVIDELGAYDDSPIACYDVRILDGNHHPASEHRSGVLRDDVPDDYIVQVAKVMATANWHIYQVLTKRANRLRDLLRTKLAFAA